MLSRTLLSAVLIFGFSPISLTAQEHCNSLISQGITNIETQYDRSYSFEYNYDKYCRLDMSKRSDSFVASAEASIFLQGSGSGSTNSSSSRERITSWCKENESRFENNRLKISTSQRQSRSSLDAWTKCLELDKKGVKVTLSSTLAHSEQVDIQLDSTLDTGLLFQSIALEGFVCDISGTRKLPNSVLDFSGATTRASTNDEGVISVGEQQGFNTYPINVNLEASNVNINCDRKAPTISDDGVLIKKKWGTGQITINTDSVQYPVSFPEIESNFVSTPPNAVLAFTEACPAGWLPYDAARDRFVMGASGVDTVGETGGRERLTPQGDHRHLALLNDYRNTRFGNDNTDDSWHTGRAGNHDHGEDGSIIPPFVRLNYCIKSAN
ncbi:MAG: hypothetical protein NXH97_21015 [Rhodobacteraceae bacterium]|nr:hypothetical protein [Paracoccaceae bacterium]